MCDVTEEEHVTLLGVMLLTERVIITVATELTANRSQTSNNNVNINLLLNITFGLM